MDTAVFVPQPPLGPPSLRPHSCRLWAARGRPLWGGPPRLGRRAAAAAPPVVARTTVYPSAVPDSGGGSPQAPTLRQLLTPLSPPWERRSPSGPSSPPPSTVTVYTAAEEALDLAAAVEAYAPTTPVVLLWHRHTACTSCVAAAKELAAVATTELARSGAELVAVGCGTADDTAAFSAASAWPGVALTDPSRASYAALTSERAAAARAGPVKCISAAAAAAAAAASAAVAATPVAGPPKKAANPATLLQGGVIVVAGGVDGLVALVHHDAYAGDHVNVAVVVAACDRIAGVPAVAQDGVAAHSV